MTSINATLTIIRRIHQLRAELLSYSREIEKVEAAEDFDFPYWQGITDEQGWLEKDVEALYTQLVSDAKGITDITVFEEELAEAHEMQSAEDAQIYIWRTNDFDDEVMRKVVVTQLSDVKWLIVGRQVWVEEEEGDYVAQWQVSVYYTQ